MSEERGARGVAIATRAEYVPVELPVGNKKLLKGFWSLLEPREQIGMSKYRCMRGDGNSEYVMIKTRSDDSDRHMSKQVGRVVPQGDKEKAVAESQNTPKSDFRVYAPSHAHYCVITSYGNPSKTGPGRQTQYILDHVGVRTLSVRAACRIHSFTTKVEEILSTRREAVALAMIGNSIPVKMYARVFINIVSSDWGGQNGEVKVEALEKSTNGMMDLVDPNLEDADKSP
jgi:site-specific DNA-cytosine methylase